MKASGSPLGSLGLAGDTQAAGQASNPLYAARALACSLEAVPRFVGFRADVVVFASSCPCPINQATVSTQKVVLFLLKTCSPIHSFALSSFVTIYWSPSLCFCYALNFVPTTTTQFLH